MTHGAEEAIKSWLVHAALDGASEENLLDGLCERLTAAGVPLIAAGTGYDVLDPVLEARGHRWRPATAIQAFESRREDEAQNDEEWLRSPFYALWQSGASTLRRRLWDDYEAGEFSLLDRFKAGGGTDYLACIARPGTSGATGTAADIYSSWLTDAPAGFSTPQIDLLTAVHPVLALALLAITARRTGRTLLSTYLGSDVATRVLAGNIVRGRAETTRAVIWYSDLVGFTRIADTAPRDEVLALLNDYAGALVRCIEQAGGEVLKFIGDGILAIFRGTDDHAACVAGLSAARLALDEIAALMAKRTTDGRPATDFAVALHLGEVMYGNFGSDTRLDFTVLGPAVNEASRIAALCRSLERRLVVSQAFAAAHRSTLVSLGRYALRGVAKPQELFTLDDE